MAIIAHMHITVLSNSTTQINIKRSSAQLAQVGHSSTQSIAANTETTAHLHITRTISESIYCIITKWIWTSIFSTTKQFGAPLIKPNTTDHHVFTPITGKIFEGSGIFISTTRFNAIYGTLRLI